MEDGARRSMLDDDDDGEESRHARRREFFHFFLFSSASLFHSGRGEISERTLLSPATPSAPLNCPEVSAIEIFMDSRAKLKPAPS